MDTLTSDRIMHDGAVSRRLVVLIALGDASRAERLAASLAASDDLLPVVAGRADVAIVDDSSGGAVPAAIPRVLLSGRAGERPAGEVLAVLQTGADDLLIAAAARLAAAGYRVSGERRTGRHEDFHT
ncbi:helix-turn-helix transcriptional regulator, partial [Mesorhizobium sp. M7A.F.Ca.US.007.01.1.1]